MNQKATIWEDGIRDTFMCNKLTLNFTFTENKSICLVLVYSVPYPDSLQFIKDKTRK